MKKLATLLLAGALTFTAATLLARAQEKTEAGSSAEKKGEGEGMMGWQWANFALLAAGLGYLVAKNAGPFFAARSHKIRQEMADAEDIRKEAEDRAGAVARRLANLDAAVAAMRQSSKEEIEAETERVSHHTAAEIAKIRAHADAEIAAAGKAARTELKRHSAQLAVALAEQKVRARMDRATQEALVRGFVHDLANPAARSESV